MLKMTGYIQGGNMRFHLGIPFCRIDIEVEKLNMLVIFPLTLHLYQDITIIYTYIHISINPYIHISIYIYIYMERLNLAA